jgi:hypothetical protein
MIAAMVQIQPLQSRIAVNVVFPSLIACYSTVTLFGQIPRLVYAAASSYGDVVGKELEGDHFQHG